MRNLWPGIFLALVVAGCVSGGRARREAQKAALEEQQRALAEQEAKEPAVWFRGDVRNQRVPWKEGLTLAEALVTAHYTWTWDPRHITVTRQGETYTISPRRLLRGQDNPLLEPGDVIEVRH
jgi:hypothetical protein